MSRIFGDAPVTTAARDSSLSVVNTGAAAITLTPFARLTRCGARREVDQGRRVTCANPPVHRHLAPELRLRRGCPGNGRTTGCIIFRRDFALLSPEASRLDQQLAMVPPSDPRITSWVADSPIDCSTVEHWSFAMPAIESPAASDV